MNNDLLILTAGRVVQGLIGIVSIRILTALLSPAEVGNYFLILAVAGFCVLTLISPAGMYVNRKLHKWDLDGNLLRRFAAGNLYLALVSVFSALAVFALNRGFGVGSSIALTGFICLTALYIYFSTCNQAIIPALNMLGHRGAFVGFTVATLVLGLGLSVIFSLSFSRTAVAWLSGQTAAMAAAAGLALVCLRRKTTRSAPGTAPSPLLRPAVLANVFSFAWPLSLTYFFMWTQNWSYRLIVEKMLSPGFLGLIGVGLGIAAGIAAAVESVAQQFYLPAFYREINGSDPELRAAAWNRMARVTLPLYLSFAVMVTFMAPFILRLLTGAEFHGAGVFLVCGAWIEFFRMATNTLATVAHAEMRTRHLIKSYSAGAVLAVAGTFLLAKHAGYAPLIPLLLAASGLVIACVMYRDMRGLMPLEIFTRELAASFLLSLPFGSAVLLYRFRNGFWASCGICALFGLYFLGSQYLLGRRLRASPEAAPGKGPPAGAGTGSRGA